MNSAGEKPDGTVHGMLALSEGSRTRVQSNERNYLYETHCPIMSGQGLRQIGVWGQGLPNNTKVNPDVGVANQTAQRKYEKNDIVFVICSGRPKKDLKSRNQKVYVSKTNQTSKTESSHYTNSMTLRHCGQQNYDTPQHAQKNKKASYVCGRAN